MIDWIIKRLPGFNAGRVAGLSEAHDLILEHWHEWVKAGRQPSRDELAYIAKRIFDRAVLK